MAPRVISICLSCLRFAPVVFITAVVVWSYYAYVVQMCIFTIENIPQKVIYLILYHPVMFMFVWSYWKTIFTDVGSVPKEFFLSRSDVELFEREENDDNKKEILARFGRNLPVQCRTSSGCLRYCEKCKCVKPDRCHHCSVCGKCVLKMDHHCPWVNNCVNFTNYKFFVLFLGYGLIYCVFIASTSIQYFIKFWTGIGGDTKMGNLHIVFLFFAGLMFALSLVSLLGYHIYLVLNNRSTLESFRAPIFRSGPDKDGFSLGKHGNFLEIFGDNKNKWFLPVYSSNGDGVSFPTRVAPPASSYHSMETTNVPTTQPSFGDGVTYPIRTIDEDYDSLLGQRQRWMEDGEADGGAGYDNAVMYEKT